MHTKDLGIDHDLAATVDASSLTCYTVQSQTHGLLVILRDTLKVIHDLVSDQSVFSGSSRDTRLRQCHAEFVKWCEIMGVDCRCASFNDLIKVLVSEYPKFTMLNVKASESRILISWLADFTNQPELCTDMWGQSATQ